MTEQRCHTIAHDITTAIYNTKMVVEMPGKSAPLRLLQAHESHYNIPG